MLKAESVASIPESATGYSIARAFERMGIAEQMKAKTKSPPAGGFSGELLLSGEAELAVQQKPELMHVAGTEIVGFLPGELNMVTEFAAAIMAGRKDARISIRADRHTSIITGFSISDLNAPISTAPRAPSTPR